MLVITVISNESCFSFWTTIEWLGYVDFEFNTAFNLSCSEYCIDSILGPILGPGRWNSE